MVHLVEICSIQLTRYGKLSATQTVRVHDNEQSQVTSWFEIDSHRFLEHHPVQEDNEVPRD